MDVSAHRAKRRILALWFPRLPTDRLQRRWKADAAYNADDAPPLVTVAKIDNALRLHAVDRKATALGLAAGMPLADARAMLPALKIVPANEPADIAVLNRIADWCDRFTPFVAVEAPRTLLLDVTGVPHLFDGERKLLDKIRADISEQGFAVRGAIAATAAAARALARYCDGAIVPPGEEFAAISALPVEALNLDPVTLHAFRRAGLKSVGQVAGRKRKELTARFGAAMVFALDHALGRAETPVSPRAPLPDYRVEQRFAEPVVTQDAILATVTALAACLAETMIKHGDGARQMEAMFFRTDGAVRRITVSTALPTCDPKIVERLFREKIDALDDPLDPGFGYDLIRLGACVHERVKEQTVSLDADESAEKDIRFLIDRLAARFGARRITAFVPNDTHIPEAAYATVPAQYKERAKLSWRRISGEGEAPRRPVRVFSKPEPISLLKSASGNGAVSFRWRRAVHRIARIEGPERIAMEWWRHQRAQPTRDYFRVEDEEGRRYWVYREGAFERDFNAAQIMSPRWFLHGVFA